MQLSGLRDVFEGKSALEFRMFKKMCYVLMTLIAASSLFMSPYLILAWNLLSRSNNIKSIHCKHFDWSEDAMTIIFCRHKGDTTGETAKEKRDAKHLYANPLMPEICPVLACAIYFACVPGHNGGPMFPGHSLFVCMS
jgi:hypothetical protein